MNCDRSYLSEVPPAVLSSKGSIGESTPVAQATGTNENPVTAAVVVFSTLPAKILNFSGTVEPPFTVFQTITLPVVMSTGWKYPCSVHAPIVSWVVPLVLL